MINSTIADVSLKENIGERVMENMLNRKVSSEISWSEFKQLNIVGIDEIALKKGQNSYVTIISAKVTKNSSPIVLGVLPDMEKEIVKTFLESIPYSLRILVQSVCTDMYNGFVYAAIEVFGVQRLVIDRYHVARLYRKPFDKLRI